MKGNNAIMYYGEGCAGIEAWTLDKRLQRIFEPIKIMNLLHRFYGPALIIRDSTGTIILKRFFNKENHTTNMNLCYTDMYLDLHLHMYHKFRVLLVVYAEVHYNRNLLHNTKGPARIFINERGIIINEGWFINGQWYRDIEPAPPRGHLIV